MEKKDISYGCLARVVRDGGFKIALIARYSAIPGHCECNFRNAPTAVIDLCGQLPPLCSLHVAWASGRSHWRRFCRCQNSLSMYISVLHWNNQQTVRIRNVQCRICGLTLIISTGTTSRKDNIIKYTILLITLVVTIGAMWYIHKRMTAVKPDVIYARRKAR